MITNKKLVCIYVMLYSVGVISGFLLLFVINFTALFTLNSHLQLILGAFIFILFISLIRVRYTQYEFMGECVTIRMNHPWNGKFIKPHIEFPKHCIKDFKINKRWLSKSIVFTIKSERGAGKKIKQNINLSGFTSLQISQIENSLIFLNEDVI